MSLNLRGKVFALIPYTSLSYLPFDFSFEKMISGMYLGELARCVLVKLANDNLLFTAQDVSDSELFQKGGFPTKFVSEVER